MSAADELHSVNYYDDPTGVPVSSGHKMRKGYTPVTTSSPSQHIYNSTFDPSDTDPDEGIAASQDLADTVEENDFWVDTTPDEE